MVTYSRREGTPHKTIKLDKQTLQTTKGQVHLRCSNQNNAKTRKKQVTSRKEQVRSNDLIEPHHENEKFGCKKTQIKKGKGTPPMI